MKIVIPVILFILLLFTLLYLRVTGVLRREKNDAEGLKKNLELFGASSLLPAMETGAKNFENIRYKKARIFAYDETELYGRLYTPETGDGKKSVLLFHAYRHDPAMDFGTLFPLYLSLGYNVLLVTQRAHGKSAGRYSSLGVTEHYDALAWCQWLEMRFGTGCPIVIHGVSMGAFAAVLAGAAAALPKNVTGIIADSVYTSAEAYADLLLQNKKGKVGKLRRTLLRTVYQRQCKTDIRKYNSLRSAKKIRVPVLLLHGEKDRLTPPSFAASFAEHTEGRTTYVCIKNAPHGMAAYSDSETVKDAVQTFLQTINP